MPNQDWKRREQRMKLSWKTYCVLAAVWIASAITTWVLQAHGAWQAIVSAPSVLALIGVLYQLVRDEAAHVKALALQHDQQRFALGITSHMADVAFDKHVALCEDFLRELFATLQSLMNNPLDHEGAKARADTLGDTVRRYALWVTPDLQARLEEFEAAVRKIAAEALLAQRHPSIGNPQKPLEMLLSLIDPGSASGKVQERELLYRQIIEHARRVLGVKELTVLRQSLLNMSS